LRVVVDLNNQQVDGRMEDVMSLYPALQPCFAAWTQTNTNP
jgi:transketolase N-terminal domain/subunit